MGSKTIPDWYLGSPPWVLPLQILLCSVVKSLIKFPIKDWISKSKSHRAYKICFTEKAAGLKWSDYKTPRCCVGWWVILLYQQQEESPAVAAGYLQHLHTSVRFFKTVPWKQLQEKQNQVFMCHWVKGRCPWTSWPCKDGLWGFFLTERHSSPKWHQMLFDVPLAQAGVRDLLLPCAGGFACKVSDFFLPHSFW